MNRKRYRRSLIPLVVALSGAAAAQPSGVYQGTIGSLPVVMNLAPAERPYENRYAYLRYGKDIELEVRANGDRLTLTEYAPPDHETGARVNAIFEGRLNGGTYTGTWKSASNGRALPFHLKRVQPTDLPFNLTPTPWLRDLRTRDPYSFIKFNRIDAFTRAGAASGGEERWRERLSGVTYPRVTAMTDRAAQERVNLWLRDLHLQESLRALECLSASGTRGDWWEANVRFVMRTSAVISLETHRSVYCGGPYPSTSLFAASYDRLRERPLEITDIFDLGPDQRRLWQLVNSRLDYPHEECNESVRTFRGGGDEQISFSPAGLRVLVDFSKVYDVCDSTVTIVPYAALRPYARVDHPLFRALYP